MPQRKRIFFRAVLPLGLLAMAAAILGRRPDDWEYETADEEEAVVVAPAATEDRRRDAAGRRAGSRWPPRSRPCSSQAPRSPPAPATRQLGCWTRTRRRSRAAQLLGTPPSPRSRPTPLPSRQPLRRQLLPRPPPQRRPHPTRLLSSRCPPRTVAVAAPSAEAAAPAPPRRPLRRTWPRRPPRLPPNPCPRQRHAPSSVAPASVASRSARQAAASRPAPAASRRPRRSGSSSARPRHPRKRPRSRSSTAASHDLAQPRLPDPTPASARLKRGFAKRLVATSRAHGADWAAVLGVLRAQGERGAVPASARELDALAARMAGKDTWKGALALSGRTGFADRAAALADLYRFVGVEALVNGYAASKQKLTRKVLSTPGVLVYSGGRSDMMMGRIDIRVVVLIGYLAERHGSVTVSSLFSGTASTPGPASSRRTSTGTRSTSPPSAARRLPGTSSPAASLRRQSGRCSSSPASSSPSR